MKKLIPICIAVVCFLFAAAKISSPVTAKISSGRSITIPDDVMKVAQKSCAICHAEHGNGMAMSKVNLSKWETYSPEKQAAKAKAMCKMVTKGKMPPKNFQKKHPESIPTQEDVKTICDWANSLQVIKK